MPRCTTRRAVTSSWASPPTSKSTTANPRDRAAEQSVALFLARHGGVGSAPARKADLKVAEFSSGRISLSFGGARRDPDADRARLRQIQDAARGGDLTTATRLAETALADGLEHPMLFNLAAARLEHEARFEEALALLERGHALAPQDVGLNQALGLCLHRLGRYAQAVPHFDTVIAAQPTFAPAHATRGATLEALGSIQEADAAYHRADELQPGNLAALSGLASLASRRGRHARRRRAAACGGMCS